MITVIAGVNGAGKSSIVGASVRNAGGDYFNPDEVARMKMAESPALLLEDANARAWKIGFDHLSKAIDEKLSYTFETTLGGNSICKLLHSALDKGLNVRIFYCGLASPELHIQRVAERVAKGGHNIPEDKIRERWNNSVHNMMGLILRCSAVRLFDNSIPANEGGPYPICLFSFNEHGFDSMPVDQMPDWAKPLASQAIKCVLGKLLIPGLK